MTPALAPFEPAPTTLLVPPGVHELPPPRPPSPPCVACAAAGALMTQAARIPPASAVAVLRRAARPEREIGTGGWESGDAPRGSFGVTAPNENPERESRAAKRLFIEPPDRPPGNLPTHICVERKGSTAEG